SLREAPGHPRRRVRAHGGPSGHPDIARGTTGRARARAGESPDRAVATPPRSAIEAGAGRIPLEKRRRLKAPHGVNNHRPPAAAPGSLTPGLDAVGETAPMDVRGASVADREEILAHCRRGDYLGAGLLAAGRAFAGLWDCDPGFEALLVAHHVSCGSWTAPWP